MYGKLRDKIAPVAATRWGWSICCFGAVCAIVAFHYKTTVGTILGALFIILGLFGLSLWIVLGKCPKCGTPILTRDMYCPKCRTLLFVKPKDLEEFEKTVAKNTAEVKAHMAEEAQRINTEKVKDNAEKTEK
ncbi:MAG: zinc ribbon domain-containing protein [Firmicutes bacterium]|nr:zinc ribbon domain-containing protein [Bacillota bacterium]